MNTMSTMKVLLVEDHYVTAKAIQAALSGENIICDISESGEEAFQIGRNFEYDVIILDLNLPDIHGQELLKKFRDSSVRAPVLIMSGIRSIQDKVKAFGFGADDYMVKPVETNELVARLRALCRRAEGHPSSIIKVNKIVLNLTQRIVYVDEKPLVLTGKEYEVLELLVRRKGACVNKETFLNRLYIDAGPDPKIVDVYVCKIRKKLDVASPGLGSCIATVWGKGYQIKENFGRDALNNAQIPSQNRVEPIPLRGR